MLVTHLEQTISVVPCQVGLFVEHSTGLAIAAPCRRWQCKQCGPRRVRAYQKRMAQVPYNRFITLTLGGVFPWTRETLKHLSASWARLRRVLAKRYALTAFTRVVERHVSGSPHLHVAVNSAYIPQKVLSILAARSGFGRVADIRAVRNKQILGYVTKYLFKTSGNQESGFFGIRYGRRIQTSARPLPKDRLGDSWSFYLNKTVRRNAWWVVRYGIVCSAFETTSLDDFREKLYHSIDGNQLKIGHNGDGKWVFSGIGEKATLQPTSQGP